MTDTELRHLSDLRVLLEGFAARHAAVRTRDEPSRLTPLREILERLNEATFKRDYAVFRDCDYALHRGIVELAEVPLLASNWQQVWEAQTAFHEQTFEECFPDARFLADEHTHLVETLAMGDPAAAEDAARSHLEAVWFRLADQEKDAHQNSGTDPLQRAVSHLAFRFSRPVSLSEVAKTIAFTSPGHLSRLFRQHYGISFQAYVQNLRLEKAAELLVSTRLPITPIARRVGYRDTSRFGQHFRRKFGLTPTAYREAE